MESCRNTPNFNREEKIDLLRKTNEAVAFENFLHTKFVGQKRFSLEGGESIIPALDTVVEFGAELGVQEFVIGMAVVEGISRAKIDQYYEGNAKKLVPILIHGDHSMAGQGIVYEVLQMSKLPGYGTGGTVHLVINNQAWFMSQNLRLSSVRNFIEMCLWTF